MLDDDGELIRPFVGWQDLRGEPYVKKISDEFGRREFYEETGDPLGTTFAITKWAWLRDNEPENWARTAIFASEQEYILKKWGAQGYWTDLSSASREGMADVDNGTWSKPIHDLIGMPLEKRATITTEPGQVVGKISAKIAALSGLAEGTLLCVGAHDQNCSTFGGGAVHPGDSVMVMGTFGSCFVVLDKPLRDPHGKLVVKPNHGIGNWTIEAFSNTSASAFRWYRDTFGDLEVATAKTLHEDPYDLITTTIAEIAPGAHGVTFLPYLQGAAGARGNGNARGCFVGMTLGTTKADMALAVLEGICFEMKDVLLAQAAAGIEIGSIRLTGGAAKSPLWCQMLADICEHPIELLQTSETGCLGAALYAGVGAGVYASCEEAVERAVKLTTRYEPNPARKIAYDEAFDTFVKVYEALDGRVF
jgi:xylulokinase